VVQGGAVGAPAKCSAGTWASWAGLQPSTGLFSFDGYRWILAGSQVAGSQTYTPTTANVGQQLRCEVTVTYPLLDVTASAASAPVNVVVPRPRLTALSESASRWRDGDKLATISRRGKIPIGTTLSFSLNTPANVSFSFSVQAAGRSAGRRCVAKTPRNAGRRVCVRNLDAGSFTLSAHSGADKIAFYGRVSRGRKLKPGNYTLSVVAGNSVGSSPAGSLKFTVVK
jgi:hypothetical protein